MFSQLSKIVIFALIFPFLFSSSYGQSSSEKLINDFLSQIKYDSLDRYFLEELVLPLERKKKWFKKKEFPIIEKKDSLQICIVTGGGYLPGDMFEYCIARLGGKKIANPDTAFMPYMDKIAERFTSDSFPNLGIRLFTPIDNYIAIEVYPISQDENGKPRFYGFAQMGPVKSVLFRRLEDGTVELICIQTINYD